MSNQNLIYYEKFRAVPQEAQKKITGGNLNGKTDINPVWRIKTLTEAFGPCGFGWYTKTVEHWFDEKQINGKTEVVAWVRLELYIKIGDQWSMPIEGIGGSKYAGKGRGDELNDESFKMAETDAISVACKKLGVGADIYWQGDNTKYTQGGSKTATASPAASLSPIGLHPEDADWRNWLVRQVANGATREQCENACNTRGRTIPADVWNKIMEAI